MLSNTIRKKIGIKPIHEDWIKIKFDKFENREFYISKNNSIQKMIWFNKSNFRYEETDYDIQLNEKNQVVTKNGKIKNFTPSFFEKAKANNKGLVVKSSSIRLVNLENKLTFINEYNCDFKSINQIGDFLSKRLENLSTYESAKLKEFIDNKKPYRYKYKTGDVFRVPLSNKQFAYGRIISGLRNFIDYKIPVVGEFECSSNVFDPSPFMFPIWVDFFKVKSENPFIPIEDLNKIETTPSVIIGDYVLRHGNYEIIGNLEIDIKSFDVPMLGGSRYFDGYKNHFLNWGLGTITFPINNDIQKAFEASSFTVGMQNHWKHLNQKIDDFIEATLNNKPYSEDLSLYEDFRHSSYSQVRALFSKEIEFEIDNNSYDNFAEKFGFKTKQEIIESCKN